ncbi:MAG: hypothetical protein QM780_09520 [Hyphomicrobium sp.]|uniref:hypothetical protein n=1 Tax=Hyphomicrobium sp. TaxID=82 RepID=UPI0039E3533A
MRQAHSRAAGGSFGFVPSFTGLLNATTIGALSIAALSAGMLWLVGIYASGLRDPRYLDGWVLAGGMALQLLFHVAIKTSVFAPKSIVRWRKVHIFIGYLLIAAFVSHCGFSLPDTTFEWALWSGFVVITLSGVFGTYLSWSLRAKGGIDEHISFERIPTRRAELADEIAGVVASRVPDAAAALPLPAPPYEAWIADLYTNHLRDFFVGPRNFTGHLIGSQRPLKQLTDEIDSLTRYVDSRTQQKLNAIRALVVEKDQLDFARVHYGLTKGWLFVHVPVTYGLIVLSVMHVLVVYSFSSGAG